MFLFAYTISAIRRTNLPFVNLIYHISLQSYPGDCLTKTDPTDSVIGNRIIVVISFIRLFSISSLSEKMEECYSFYRCFIILDVWNTLVGKLFRFMFELVTFIEDLKLNSVIFFLRVSLLLK